MAGKVDLYDRAYGHYDLPVYRQVRVETYGEDLGQTSWVTTEESGAIPQLLALNKKSSALEIGCGSGRYALSVAQKIGCRIVGVDINRLGIQNARQLAEALSLATLVRFEQCDVSSGLPFEDSRFDAVFSNDVLCHVPGRPAALAEIFRVLKPGGRFLFSDALVIGGVISHEEIAQRSSIGYYAFSPPGENEKLLRNSGFEIVSASETSAAAAAIAKRWRDARAKHREELLAAEGQNNFEGLQRFLSCVEKLTSERRLLRFLYLARKEA